MEGKKERKNEKSEVEEKDGDDAGWESFCLQGSSLGGMLLLASGTGGTDTHLKQDIKITSSMMFASQHISEDC